MSTQEQEHERDPERFMVWAEHEAGNVLVQIDGLLDAVDVRDLIERLQAALEEIRRD